MKKSLALFYPRKYNPFLNLNSLPTSNLEGNFIKDGLSKYDLDFIETVKFTKKCLSFLESVDPLQYPVKSIKGNDYLCFSVKDDYNYDYTKPESPTTVSLIVDLKKLPLKEQELSLLKTLCQDKISENQVLKLSLDDLNGAPLASGNAAQFLASRFLDLIDQSRKLDAVPVSSKKSREYPFPKEWLRVDGNF